MSAALRPDVLVIGLGAMGSQTLLELARRGVRVVGIDRAHPPHDLGSSHGRSRIIREAYFEDPLYVPLVQRAFARWRDLEAEGDTPLLHVTGGLCLGPTSSRLVTGALTSARQHRLPYERLEADELRRRFPAHRVPDEWVGILEPRAGILDPERCIATALHLARHHGATLHLGEAVTGWTVHANHVEVRTDRRTLLADRLVVSAGMWMAGLVPMLRAHLTVSRQVLFWFAPRIEATPEAFAPTRFPVFLSEVTPGRIWYGFPDVGDGVKVAWHHAGPDGPSTALAMGPEGAPRVDRTVAAHEVASMRAHLATHLPWADGFLRQTAVCTYTTTPDEHFLIDRAPDTDRVWLASPCSGHGFKFASAIGEALADLVTDVTPTCDLSPFRLGRLRS